MTGAVRRHLETFLSRAEDAERTVPRFVARELRALLRCGVRAHGFLRLWCAACRKTRVVGFSCKGRGVCPSCGGRRMAETAAHLVDRVLPDRPMRQWVLSFPWALRRALGYDPALLSDALTVVQRVIFGWIRGRVRGRVGLVDASDVHPGSVTFIQRFGDALNLNPHFHSMVLDGAYVTWGGLRWVPVDPPTTDDVTQIVKTIRRRVLGLLRRRGVIDEDDRLLHDEDDDGSVLLPLEAASVQGVAAMGPEAGRKLKRPGQQRELAFEPPVGRRCAAVGGFSLHADVAVGARDRKKRERLCRYMARPPVARERLALLPNGRVLYRFKKRWRDGSLGVEMDGVEFIGKLAALIPRPRQNLVRYHGCFAPASPVRGFVVRDRGPRGPAPVWREAGAAGGERGAAGVIRKVAAEAGPVRPRNYRWAELMRRVFEVDVLQCPSCGDPMRVVASIEDPIVARKILEHLGLPAEPLELEPARGPPDPECPEAPPLLDDEWL